MALKIVVLALLVWCTACEAQSQGDDTSLPLVYNGRIITADSGNICPDDAIRENTRESIAADIQSNLQETVFPAILLSEGWTRVAFLNMSDPNEQCPVGFVTLTSPRRACGRNTNNPSCRSVVYPANSVSYNRVCGRVIAYQYFSTEAFQPFNDDATLTVDNVYVNGVSITHGSNPREHVWTFASAYYESYIGTIALTCPCTNTDNINNNPSILIPSFVGNDYFCDTGTSSEPTNAYYPDDPLWDGEGCGPTSTCCEFNNPPWFCKTLPQPTTDDIEVRLCGDGSSTNNEDTPLELIEIYTL